MKLTMNWLLACLVSISLALTGCSSETDDSNDSADASDTSDAPMHPTQAIHQHKRDRRLRLRRVVRYLRATFEAEYDFASVEGLSGGAGLAIFSHWNSVAELWGPIGTRQLSVGATTTRLWSMCSRLRGFEGTISRLISTRLKAV